MIKLARRVNTEKTSLFRDWKMINVGRIDEMRTRFCSSKAYKEMSVSWKQLMDLESEPEHDVVPGYAFHHR